MIWLVMSSAVSPTDHLWFPVFHMQHAYCIIPMWHLISWLLQYDYNNANNIVAALTRTVSLDEDAASHLPRWA